MSLRIKRQPAQLVFGAPCCSASNLAEGNDLHLAGLRLDEALSLLNHHGVEGAAGGGYSRSAS